MRLTRFASPLALALVVSLSACRQPSTPTGKAPIRDKQDRREIALPDPLPLPAEPPAAAWLAEPARALGMISPYSPVPIDAPQVAEQGLSMITTPELAAELSRAIDLRAPLGYVAISREQEIIRLSLRADARESIGGRLSELEAVGEFGAVRLPGQDSEDTREWLAWIDDGDGGTLVIANSLPGLVTGRTLAAAYGDEPIYFTTDLSLASALAPLPVEIPLSRVSGRGTLDRVVVEALARDGEDPLADVPISPGSLGGLLGAGDIAIGASGRYAESDAVVREITSQVNAQVRELPFLVKGIGEDLAAKLNTLLRTWDGRTLVALGPANHVRIAYGASDTKKSGVAMVRLLQTVVDNVSLARNFVSQLPRLSLRRRVAKAAGLDIELFVIQDAHSYVPPELRALIDKESRLNIAMAWSESGGGGLIVVGPDAVAQLSSWLEQTREAPRHDETAGQLLAACFAMAPEALPPLMTNSEVDPAKLLGASAAGPRWDVAVAPAEGGRYVIELTMPNKPKPRADIDETYRPARRMSGRHDDAQPR